MFNEFSPHRFFDLSKHLFADLFNSCAYVWEAIPLLPSYIGSVLKAEILGEIEEGAWVEPGMVRLEEGSRVERGAVVRGPAIIGRNTVVRSHAHIRGGVITGENCMVGHLVALRQVLMLDNTNVAHQNLVSNSLFGSRVNLAGHSQPINYSPDRDGEIVIKSVINGETRSFPTGIHRFGAVMGDDSQLGGMALTMPGTIIGKRCFIYPRCIASGFVPDDSIVKSK